jgi:hypothetical protein
MHSFKTFYLTSAEFWKYGLHRAEEKEFKSPAAAREFRICSHAGRKRCTPIRQSLQQRRFGTWSRDDDPLFNKPKKDIK